jgi:hypothetical protein
MRKYLAVVLTGLIMAVSACGVNVEAGTVTEKRFEEAYVTQDEVTEEECEWDTDTKTKVVNGKTKTETKREYECEDVATGETIDVQHPAQYFLTLEDKDGNDDEVEVTESEYNSVEVKDYFEVK